MSPGFSLSSFLSQLCNNLCVGLSVSHHRYISILVDGERAGQIKARGNNPSGGKESHPWDGSLGSRVHPLDGSLLPEAFESLNQSS